MNQPHEDRDLRIEQAISARLSKLASTPVDTSRLADGLRREISPVPTARRALGWTLRIAAMLLVVVTLLLVANAFTGPALASPARLAEIHAQVTSGQGGMVMQATSMENAAKAITDEWAHAPEMPHMPGKHVMACSVHEMGRKKMAVVGMQVDGEAVTMAVADQADVKSPAGDVLVRNGTEYLVSSADGVNMAMTKREGRWVCLMGRVSTDRLIDIIARLKF